MAELIQIAWNDGETGNQDIHVIAGRASRPLNGLLALFLDDGSAMFASSRPLLPRHGPGLSMIRLAMIVMLLVCAAPCFANEQCPEYKGATEGLPGLVRGNQGGATLADAYDRAAQAWLCLNPRAGAKEINRWLRSLPSNAAGRGALEAVHVSDEELIFVWRRDDFPAGGRVSLFSRLDGSWRRSAFVELDVKPELLGTISRGVVVGEVIGTGDMTWMTIRVLRAEGGSLVELFKRADLIEPRVSKAGKGLRIRYRRLPQGYAPQIYSDLQIELELQLGEKDGKIVERTVSLSPQLEFLEAYCAARANGDDEAARFVEPFSLISQLPACGDVTFLSVRKSDRGFIADVEGWMECVPKVEDAPWRTNRARLAIRQTKNGLRVVGIAAEDRSCRITGPARPSPALPAPEGRHSRHQKPRPAAGEILLQCGVRRPACLALCLDLLVGQQFPLTDRVMSQTTTISAGPDAAASDE